MDRKVILFLLLAQCVCLPALAQQEWREHKTLHYVIYYQETPESFIETLGSEAEDLFGKTADDMGFDSYPRWRQEDRVKIYVFDNKEEYEAAGPEGRREGTSGMAHIAQRAISMYVKDRDSFLKGTLPHELGHIFFYEYVGRRSDIPGWFSEGIAMLQEDRDQQQRDDRVKKAVGESGYISLRKLQLDPDDRFYYYSVAYSATQYLLSRITVKKQHALFDLLRNGRSFEEALREVSNNKISDVERLNQDWMDAIKAD